MTARLPQQAPGEASGPCSHGITSCRLVSMGMAETCLVLRHTFSNPVFLTLTWPMRLQDKPLADLPSPSATGHPSAPSQPPCVQPRQRTMWESQLYQVPSATGQHHTTVSPWTQGCKVLEFREPLIFCLQNTRVLRTREQACTAHAGRCSASPAVRAAQKANTQMLKLSGRASGVSVRRRQLTRPTASIP